MESRMREVLPFRLVRRSGYRLWPLSARGRGLVLTDEGGDASLRLGPRGPSTQLIIQIPCLNEAELLLITLGNLPRSIAGFDVVEWLIIDDGSTDDTVGVARREGVDHILSLGCNRGLAEAFMAGLEFSLKLGADVIINTDADNQYAARCIPDLVRPIPEYRALIVVVSAPSAIQNIFRR